MPFPDESACTFLCPYHDMHNIHFVHTYIDCPFWVHGFDFPV